MDEFFKKLLNIKNLSFNEAYELVSWMMSDDAIDIKTAAFLAFLQIKGVSVEELAGATKAMRDLSIKVKAPKNTIDTCSTGGNGIKTFNISTCAAIIASAAGAIVAKHGNKTNTRKSGSSEVLEKLGVNIQLGVSEIENCLKKIGICF